HRNNDEVGTPDLEGDFSDEPAKKACAGDARQEAAPYGLRRHRETEGVGDLKLEAERDERADIRTKSEKPHVPQAKLPAESKEQVEAHRCDDENPGYDHDVKEVGIAGP